MFIFGGGINELLLCLVRLSSEISVVEVGIGDGLSFIFVVASDGVGVLDLDDDTLSGIEFFSELFDEDDATDELDVSADSFSPWLLLELICFSFRFSSFLK
jgi:hypothetical protein